MSGSKVKCQSNALLVGGDRRVETRAAVHFILFLSEPDLAAASSAAQCGSALVGIWARLKGNARGLTDDDDARSSTLAAGRAPTRGAGVVGRGCGEKDEEVWCKVRTKRPSSSCLGDRLVAERFVRPSRVSASQ